MPSRSDALVVAIAAALYTSTLGNGFCFDDHRAIEQNPCVAADGECASLLTTDFWGTPLTSRRSHRSYRPLSVLSLRVNARLFGSGAASYHAANVLLHALNSWLLWQHASVALGGRAAPLAAALLYASHPVNSEAVAYCAGRADLLAAALGMLGMLLHGRARARAAAPAAAAESAARAAADSSLLLSWLSGTLCLAMALASKETALVLLPACVASDVILLATSSRSSDEAKRLARTMAPGWMCLAALAAGFVALRAHLVGPIAHHFRRLDNPIPSMTSATARALACARVHLLCASLLVWPATLSADYSYDALSLGGAGLPSSTASAADAAAAASAAASVPVGTTTATAAMAGELGCKAAALYLSILLGGAWLLAVARGSSVLGGAPRDTPRFTLRQRHLARAGLGWAVLLLLAYAPAAHTFLPLSFVVAERLLYMPCAAFCLLVSAAIAASRHRPPCRDRSRPSASMLGATAARRVMMAGALVGGGARTLRRCVDWRDDTALFTAAAAAYPRSAKAVYQLADLVVKAGRPDEAVPLLKRALSIEPNYHFAYLHLARLALQRADATVAFELAQASIRAVPSPNPHGHALAARAALLQLQIQQQLRQRPQQPQLPPPPPQQSDLASTAAAHARSAVMADPAAADVGDHLSMLGEALTMQQRWPEAADAFEAALHHRPQAAAVLVNAGAALLKLGRRPAEATARFERAVALLAEASLHAVDGGRTRTSGLMEKAQRGLRLSQMLQNEQGELAREPGPRQPPSVAAWGAERSSRATHAEPAKRTDGVDSHGGRREATAFLFPSTGGGQ